MINTTSLLIPFRFDCVQGVVSTNGAVLHKATRAARLVRRLDVVGTTSYSSSYVSYVVAWMVFIVRLTLSLSLFLKQKKI